ncbi:hypothetical protein C0J52_21307, partial [Blattella germanica]
WNFFIGNDSRKPVQTIFFTIFYLLVVPVHGILCVMSWLQLRKNTDIGRLWIVLLVLVTLVCCETSLYRKKRALNFPEGSTFSVAFCNTYKTLTNDVDIFTMGLQWALSYNLPNETLRDPDTNRLILRRHRRALYSKLEQAMDASGVDGRACVERALCETAHHLPPGANVLAEMLRILFT